jgi:hypothetical protein
VVVETEWGQLGELGARGLWWLVSHFEVRVLESFLRLLINCGKLKSRSDQWEFLVN